MVYQGRLGSELGIILFPLHQCVRYPRAFTAYILLVSASEMIDECQAWNSKNETAAKRIKHWAQTHMWWKPWNKHKRAWPGYQFERGEGCPPNMIQPVPDAVSNVLIAAEDNVICMQKTSCISSRCVTILNAAPTRSSIWPGSEAPQMHLRHKQQMSSAFSIVARSSAVSLRLRVNSLQLRFAVCTSQGTMVTTTMDLAFQPVLKCSCGTRVFCFRSQSSVHGVVWSSNLCCATFVRLFPFRISLQENISKLLPHSPRTKQTKIK